MQSPSHGMSEFPLTREKNGKKQTFQNYGFLNILREEEIQTTP